MSTSPEATFACRCCFTSTRIPSSCFNSKTIALTVGSIPHANHQIVFLGHHLHFPGERYSLVRPSCRFDVHIDTKFVRNSAINNTTYLRLGFRMTILLQWFDSVSF